MKKYVIGLDIGTTSAKAVVFDYDGNAVSEAESGYRIVHPSPGYAEQDPAEIEHAAKEVIRTAMEQAKISVRQLTGVGLSAAMHSLICIDENGEALSPSIIWADTRSHEEAAYLKREHHEIYLRTGTPLHPMTPLSKLMWGHKHGKTEWQKARYFVSIKEYLIKRWFNEHVVDYSIAAATGMFDIHKHRWDNDALSLAGIKEAQLFTPVPPTYTMTGLKADIAAHTGLAAGTPFVIGGSDGPLANLGIGAINPGETAVTIGTSGAIRQFSRKPLLDDKQEVFSYSFTDDFWITGGPSNNGGTVLNWLKQLWDDGQLTFEEMVGLAGEVEAGAEKLLFLPYLNGERAPFWDAKARGSFIGLTPTHHKKHMIRAGMEGVIFSIYHIAFALERLGNHHTTLLASGGFVRSPLWVQILADVFGKPVHIPDCHQSSAWGAAWVALYSLQEVDSLEGIKHSIPMKKSYHPNQESHETYQQLFDIYKTLYHQLQTCYSDLHQLKC
ncbi:gluconokinase [Thalassobacillus cyri]|uniref:Gluconokinase n=1 Tax=Thalassobacillus cyri TaxID=571932 RepID=A0A1H4DTJ8_9BACI|nr:gluconokinase [Thalassobacillus cyri]SEA76105.1 gluconokinase [Thalassobacillus cyri]